MTWSKRQELSAGSELHDDEVDVVLLDLGAALGMRPDRDDVGVLENLEDILSRLHKVADSGHQHHGATSASFDEHSRLVTVRDGHRMQWTIYTWRGARADTGRQCSAVYHRSGRWRDYVCPVHMLGDSDRQLQLHHSHELTMPESGSISAKAGHASRYGAVYITAS